MKKFFRIFVLALLMLPLFPRNISFAADINTGITLVYSVSEDGLMHIKETKTVRNNSSRFFIPSTSAEKFTISTFKTRSTVSREDLQRVANTIKLTTSAGALLNPTIEIKTSTIDVSIPIGTDLYRNSSKTFILEYDNFELVEKIGNAWNIYIPGLPEEHDKVISSESGATSQANFSIMLELAETFANPNFILPEPASTSKNGKTTYTFDADSLVNQSVWIQIGQKQYYKFDLTQEVQIPSGFPSKFFNTTYDLLLPTESAIGNQEVHYTSIIPKPKYVRLDGEGNLVARFVFDREAPQQIIAQGYIVVNITDEIKKKDVGDLDSINLSKAYSQVNGKELTLNDLLSQAEYWEVEAGEIQSQAIELQGKKTNVLEILLADYNFVTENVDYDNLKTGIDNERQGALKTLQGGSSVCMEYSDLLITLLRAQKIPARAAFGYGFDPKATAETDEGHQWVEVYLPNNGWVAVDPTWGDTGRKNYIGGDIDHALWYVAGTSVEEPSPVTKYSFFDNTKEIEAPSFKIEAVENIDLENASTVDELLSQYPYTEKNIVLQQADHLNNTGKITLGGIIGLLLLILLITIASSVAKHQELKIPETNLS